MSKPSMQELIEWKRLKDKLFPPGVMFRVVDFTNPDELRYNELSIKVLPILQKIARRPQIL